MGRVSGARERLWEGRMKKEAGYRGTLLPGNSHLPPKDDANCGRDSRQMDRDFWGEKERL